MLFNLNYGKPTEKQAFDDEKTGLADQKQAFMAMISGLNVSTPTKKNMIKFYDNFGFDVIFARDNIMKITGLTMMN